MRKVSSVRGDPTPAQEESWSPDEMLEMLLSYQTKPIGRVRLFLLIFNVHVC